jgi:septum formation protein
MQQLPPLILASTSRYRRALLERLRVPFETLAPAWEEVRLDEPDATVLANALGKTRAAARARPEAAVLASDQVGWCAGRILEKPGTPEAARAQLTWLAGREHTLHTSVVLRTPDGREAEETIVARLRVRALRAEEIAAYVRLDEPLDCAGSYKTEALGIALFEALQCDDPTAIEGLPLITVCRLLRSAGWEIPPPDETASDETGSGGVSR